MSNDYLSPAGFQTCLDDTQHVFQALIIEAEQRPHFEYGLTGAKISEAVGRRAVRLKPMGQGRWLTAIGDVHHEDVVAPDHSHSIADFSTGFKAFGPCYLVIEIERAPTRERRHQINSPHAGESVTMDVHGSGAWYHARAARGIEDAYTPVVYGQLPTDPGVSR